MLKEQFVQKFKAITGISFVNIRNYTNKEGEVADILININVSYNNSKAKDIEILKNLNLNDYVNETINLTLLEQAKIELINSLTAPSETRSEGQINAYTHLCNNIKVHNETNELYITGMKIRKTIHTEGTYKEVKSKPLTIAKNILRKELTTSKIRQYIVKKVAAVTLNKEVLQSEQVVELA